MLTGPISVRAGMLDERRLPALRRGDVAARAAAPPATGPRSPAGCIRWGRISCTVTRERMVGDHSPNWGGVPRHDLGVLDKANDPWRESLDALGHRPVGVSGQGCRDGRGGVRAPPRNRRSAAQRRSASRSASPSASCCRIRRTSRGARTTSASQAACRRRRIPSRHRDRSRVGSAGGARIAASRDVDADEPWRGAHRVLRARVPPRRADRRRAAMPRRRGPRRRTRCRLFDRSRRPARRARPVVEAHAVRGFGARAAR